MNVEIIERSSHRVVAIYPADNGSGKEPPTVRERADDAWTRAVADKLVDPDRRTDYETRVGILEFGTTPENDLWPWTLLDGARASASVADATMKQMPGLTASSPQYLTVLYLLAHAIELALKAFLRGRGYSELQLTGIKHNLPRALKAAVRHGFPEPHSTDKQLLELLDATYAAQRKLQYHRASAINMPLLRPIRELAGVYLAHTFMSLGGSSKVVSERGAAAYGLYVDPDSNYAGQSLVDFRDSAGGVNLRSQKTID